MSGAIACAWSVALLGMRGQPVEIEAAVGGGLPRTVLVGLPDAALYEARDRCRAAVASSGFDWPASLMTINLTPASLPKAGSHYDLGIVAAVLAATGVGSADRIAGQVFLGELGLDGRVRPVRGVLPALLAAVEHGFDRAVVPAAQWAEAALVDGIAITGVADLRELADLLRGRPRPVRAAEPEPAGRGEPAAGPEPPDLADVAGQLEARWALEVAAAGRHHLFLQGPPGVGKTMLAERLPGILPPLRPSEGLEVCAVQSLAGRVVSDRVPELPPLADPHHTASVASLVGGGARIARPGAVSLAHRGVLFLDEAAEFSPRALDALRTPLETGQVTLARAAGQVSYPASFQLLLAANPCPCGNSGVAGAVCECAPAAVRRYRSRLSGPVLDRVDIHQELRPLRKALLRSARERAESSAAVAARVAGARLRALARMTDTPWTTNGEMPGPWIRAHWPAPGGVELVEEAMLRGKISGRGADKVIRVAWTLADLAGRDGPGRDEVRLALALRRGEAALDRVAG
ncbi:YifB family Mg chelatase-like AAA ATPase [Naumannella huperziae]